MREHLLSSKRAGRALAAAAGALAVSTLFSAPARAHFVLDSPASSTSQDNLGNPQKAPPCGDDGSATATGEVTTFAAGQTISITLHETVFHPGHYRIALAVNDRSELPAEPVVTPGSTACGSTEIQDPPVFPVLADGVLLHTTPLDGPQTIEVTLPADVTCDHCTLQVLEFMSNHGLNNPGGCYYHHCADIAITASSSGDGGGPSSSTSTTTGATSTSASGGTSAASGSGGGAAEETSSDDDCGCSVPGAGATSLGGLASLVALGALVRRRRGRR